jgi:YVTN family beta-propeller protein
MKRLLLYVLALLLVLLVGCVVAILPAGNNMVFVVTCEMVAGGVQYTSTPFEVAFGIFQQSGKTTTSPVQPTSTCAQFALTVLASGGTILSDSRAQTTAAKTQFLEVGLDQANLAVQIIAPSTLNFTEVDLPGEGNTQYPTGMDITPDGSAIWVTQLAIGQNNAGITPEPPLVSIMNVAQQAFTGSFTLPNGISPNTIRFSVDGTSAYVTNDGSPAEGESGVFANSSVLVVNVATETVTKTIPTPKGAGSAVLSPDGLLLYTIGNNFGLGSNNLTVIDTTTNTVATSVALPDGGIKIFVNPTGTRLYIFRLRGIDVFDTATLQQVASIPANVSILTNYAFFSDDGGTALFCPCGYGTVY